MAWAGRFLLVALFVVPASACARTGDGPTVVASTPVIADLARNVAGERQRVATIAPQGAHVEEYEPKPDDARRLGSARLVLLNGLGLDRWAEPLVRSAAPSASTVTLTDGLPRIEEGDGEGGDPHYWLDASYARTYVERIRDALVALDPAGREGYLRNAETYLRTLDALDREIRAQVATIPEARRKLVTSHDAFPFFARAYGFEVVGFTQTEEGKEPSPAELARLVERVKVAGVPAIFVETGASPRLAQTLAREAGVTRIVDDLPTDSLGAAPADTYVGMMRVIVSKIVEALR